MSGTKRGGHGTKAIVAAFLANLGIAAAKFVGFAFTRSASMLAEGVHSAADTGNQLLLLFGGRRSRKEADADHPFGYGRERYFWAFVVAIVLFTLGATFAIYDGIQKIHHPHALEKAKWAYGILGIAVLLEGLSFRTAMKESRKARPEGTGLWRYVRNAKAPEIPVVILEDFAALTGLVIALAAVIVSELTHNPKWDAYGTIAIGGLLGIVALVLASEMKSLLIGESASPNVQEAIRAALEIEPAVMKVIHLRTQHLGPEELLVAAKVEFLHHLTLPEVAEAVDRVEANVRANVPEAKVMYIEPDVAREFVAEPLVAEHTGLSTSEWLEETTGQLQAIAVESGSDEPLAAEELAEPGPPSLPPLMLDPDAPPYPPPPPPAPDLTRTRPIASSDLWGRRPGLAGDLPSDSEADIDNTGGS